MRRTTIEFESRVKDRVERGMREAAAEIKRYDFKSRVDELIKAETERWRYTGRDQLRRITEQFEKQLAKATDDEAVQTRIQEQVDAAIDGVLSEDRIRDMVDDWIDDWIEETVREQLEIRLAEKVGVILDAILAENDIKESP